MADRARIEAIEAGLSSSNLEDVHDAIIDIGKQGHRELIPRVVPYLTSTTGFLREAAVLALVFHLRSDAHKRDAIRMLELDPDEGVRQAAAMGLGNFASEDRELLQRLVAVALCTSEQDIVRAAALNASLVAAGAERSELPTERQLPDFDARADWGTLARVLYRAGIALPAELGRRLAARPVSGVVLTGAAAKAFADAIGERNRKLRAERLAAAKAEAVVRGKEPFDLARLETMCDTSSHGRVDPVEVRHAEFEERYYVWYRDLMTLAELAAMITELNRWW